MSNKTIFANGINGRSGNYLIPPMSSHELVTQIRGETTENWVASWFGRIREVLIRPFLGLPYDIHPEIVSEAGWAIVFPENASSDLRKSLEPLIAWRRAQIPPDRFKDKLYWRKNETLKDWRKRYGVSEGDVQPKNLPYYILLVGNPTEISFEFQCLLDVEYAVGRLAFDNVDQYRQYAESIVAYEKANKIPNSREIMLWGTRHKNDGFTESSSKYLVNPLCKGDDVEPPLGSKHSFALHCLKGPEATKANLLDLLCRDAHDSLPAILFTASHGMGGWPKGHPQQQDNQGALLCQDWPGLGSIGPSCYLAAKDVPDDARLHGMVAFMVACYGAGTPAFDSFFYDSSTGQFLDRSQGPVLIADRPFVAALPQRLLSHPRGGALAVIGHTERIWNLSFLSPELIPFRNFFGRVMSGEPIGHAMQDFNTRYATLAADLLAALDGTAPGPKPTEEELAVQWIERTDAQNYTVLGDPAARVRVKDLS